MKKDFSKLGLSENILEAIKKMGIEEPSDIQDQLIPHIMDGYDCIGQAQTGTGKTLAFAASILSKLKKGEKNVKSIILTPTRELALQICKEFNKLDETEFKTFAVYGGDSIDRQIKTLKTGIDIVVGTPGRVMDLIRRKKLNLTTIDFFVLDEADEMLNMGFLEDIETILKNTSRDKQVIMMSATMPKQIVGLSKKYMREDFKHVEVISNTKTGDNISQYYYLVNDKHRLEILCRVLDSKKLYKSIIFGNTKVECDMLASELQARGYSAEAIHGDISQALRMKTLDKFKRGTFNYLIATDVAARGIHIDDIDLVVNYRLPQDKEIYVHRIGRTGRANKMGEAVSFIASKDRRFMNDIVKFTNCEIMEKAIPQSEEIINAKYSKVMDEVKKVLEENDYNDAIPFVRDLNKGDLMTLSAALLKYVVGKEIGSDVKKVIEVKERTVRDINIGKTRVFLNIGKKDKLKKGSLLDFIKESTKMNKDYFTNIEVLSTFTFIDVDDAQVNEFIDKFTGKVFNNRKIRIEISKNKSKNAPKKRKYSNKKER